MSSKEGSNRGAMSPAARSHDGLNSGEVSGADSPMARSIESPAGRSQAGSASPMSRGARSGLRSPLAGTAATNPKWKQKANASLQPEQAAEKMVDIEVTGLPGLRLEAEPPADTGFEALYSELPAVLLSKVDGDELAELLDSRDGTPFSSPRLTEQEQIPSEVQSRAQTAGSGRSRKEKSKQPPNIENKFERRLLSPGQIDVDTETDKKLDSLEHENITDAAMVASFKKPHEMAAHDLQYSGEWLAPKEGEREWSVLDFRILYMVSLYANQAESAEDEDGWIKLFHLVVLMFEGIEKELINLRKSPSWMYVTDEKGQTRKLWMNVAQRGIGILNDLCAEGLVNCLRIVTKDSWPTSAYQCSIKGQELMQEMPYELKAEMDELLHGPDEHAKEPLQVVIEDMKIWLKTYSGYARQSEVTEMGRVPYVGSPYVPTCLRHSGHDTKENSAAAYHCPLWESQVPDRRMEAVVFGNVTVSLTEWLPVGGNSITAIVDQLNGYTYVKHEKSDTHFISRLDDCPAETSFKARERQTRATMLDWKLGHDVNLEAVVEREEEPPVQRVQEFGVHINASGVVMSGLQIEALGEREWDDIPPDLLAFATLDLHKDTSIVLHDLISKLQRDVLSCLFEGHEMERTKFVCVSADFIEPKFSVEEYMDGGRFESELVQLIGEVHTAKDLGSDDLLFVGLDGVIVVGPNTRLVEDVIVNYLSLTVIDQTIQRFYMRTRILNDALVKLHQEILSKPGITDPEAVSKARQGVQKAGQDLQLLESLLSHIQFSIDSWVAVERPKDHVGRALYEGLELRTYSPEVQKRANDLTRLLKRLRDEIVSLTEIADLEDRMNLEGTYASVQEDMKLLSKARGASLTHAGHMRLRTEVPMKVVQVSFAAMLGNAVINRIHVGIELKTGAPKWFQDFMGGFNDSPFMFLLFFVGWIVLFCVVMMWYIRSHTRRAHGYLWKSVQLNLKIINAKALLKFLDSSACQAAVHNIEKTDHLDRKTISGTFLDRSFFRWYGEPPMVTIKFDATNRWVLNAEFGWPYMSKWLSKHDVKATVIEMLADAGVIEKPVEKKKPRRR